jgi:uncharacterized damage-inducible protein DinB
MDIKTITDLYRHMQWADAKVWASLLESESGRSDQKVRDYLYHLHMVQNAFLRIWRGVPRETPFPTFDDAPSLMEWARANYGELFTHLETLTDEKLAEPMDMPWADMIEKQLGRKPEGTLVGNTVLQVVLHSMYHRGQVNARLREVGVAPPLVDYIAWLWIGRPAAEWPGAQLTSGGL